MIAIVNVSKKLSPSGWHDYEIRINATVIAKFRHKREESLAVCLYRAAEAVANGENICATVSKK